MSLGWIIYFIGILDNIIGCIVSCTVLSAIAFIILSIVLLFQMNCGDEEETWIEIKKYYISSILSFIIFLNIAILTPSSKLAATIYLLPKIVENEEVQKMPNNAMKLLNSKMEEWIKDLTTNEGETK